MAAPVPLFGPTAKSAANIHRETSPVPDEEHLLHELRLKLGPHASQSLLQQHVRACRGKLHWTVNCYFRDVLLEATSGAPLDYEPKAGQTLAPPPLAAPATSPAAATWHAAAATSARADQADTSGLDGLPCSVLEEICQNLDVMSLCAFAQVSRICLKAAHADGAWQLLFSSRWGDLEFPITPKSSPKPQPSPNRAPAHPNAPLPHPPHPPAPAPIPAPAHPPPPREAQASTSGPTPTPPSTTPPARAGPLHLTSLATQLPPISTAADPTPPTHARPRPSRPPPSFHSDPSTTPTPSTPTASASPPTPTPSSPAPPAPSTSSAPPTPSASTSAPSAPSPSVPSTSAPSAPAPSSSAPPPTWRTRYYTQHRYEATMACPRCSGQRIVPIVYGFPSAPLMAGMRGGRLLLGGDHLIENCHVWACTACNASYRSFPFRHVGLWVNDQEQESKGGQDGEGRRAYTYEL